jgi:hypothetical protein
LHQGSRVNPLRSSPTETTLRYKEALSWTATQFLTRESGMGLVSSEGMLVSSRKPLTTGPLGVRWKDCG